MGVPPKRTARFSPSEQSDRKRRSTALCKQRQSAEKNGLKLRFYTPNPSTSKGVTRRDPLAHDSQLDIEFRADVLQYLNDAGSTLGSLTWGAVTAQNVSRWLLQASLPTTNLESVAADSPVQALFLEPQQAKNMLATSSNINTPIFVRSKQIFPWNCSSRPIDQVLAKYSSTDTVDVNVSSLPYSGHSYQRKTIAELRDRFGRRQRSEDAWNALNLKFPFPETWGTCPQFLQNSNCELLNHIKRKALDHGSAGRSTTTAAALTEWRDAESWMLLAEPGSITDAHQDSFGYDSFITVVEGEIGFGWLDRPTDEQLRAWAKSQSSFRDGNWAFTVLKPRTTVWFPAGTVHFVVRRRNEIQTLGMGGHVLRYSAVSRWAAVLDIQLEYPKSTNERMPKLALKLLDLMGQIVSEAEANADTEKFGGKPGIQNCRQGIEKCYNTLKRRYPKMRNTFDKTGMI